MAVWKDSSSSSSSSAIKWDGDENCYRSESDNGILTPRVSLIPQAAPRRAAAPGVTL
ncbi:hypothetical protein [Streptosporangium canum]|uniref:hypothetical protein n=1 Tax=Streptosporangium canum TaxID=324952 RepID=UPI0033A6593E